MNVKPAALSRRPIATKFSRRDGAKKDSLKDYQPGKQLLNYQAEAVGCTDALAGPCPPLVH
ncbi:MAG TPA: hypothetical protein VFF86_04390 [Candidatus Methylomirabilis sp.]|nr:hypothetical protein [Candidatus Methylomirabilis sp.]